MTGFFITMASAYVAEKHSSKVGRKIASHSRYKPGHASGATGPVLYRYVFAFTVNIRSYVSGGKVTTNRMLFSCCSRSASHTALRISKFLCLYQALSIKKRNSPWTRGGNMGS